MNWSKLLKLTAIQILCTFVLLTLYYAAIDGGFQRWGQNIQFAFLLFWGNLIINYWQEKNGKL